MRLIDVDKLIDFIDCGHLRHPTELCFSEIDVVNMLNHAPTACDCADNVTIQNFANILSSRLTDAIRPEDVESMKNLIKDVVNELSKQGGGTDEM